MLVRPIADSVGKPMTGGHSGQVQGMGRDERMPSDAAVPRLFVDVSISLAFLAVLEEAGNSHYEDGINTYTTC